MKRAIIDLDDDVSHEKRRFNFVLRVYGPLDLDPDDDSDSDEGEWTDPEEYLPCLCTQNGWNCSCCIEEPSPYSSTEGGNNTSSTRYPSDGYSPTSPIDSGNGDIDFCEFGGGEGPCGCWVCDPYGFATGARDVFDVSFPG